MKCDGASRRNRCHLLQISLNLHVQSSLHYTLTSPTPTCLIIVLTVSAVCWEVILWEENHHPIHIGDSVVSLHLNDLKLNFVLLSGHMVILSCLFGYGDSFVSDGLICVHTLFDAQASTPTTEPHLFVLALCRLPTGELILPTYVFVCRLCSLFSPYMSFSCTHITSCLGHLSHQLSTSTYSSTLLHCYTSVT